MKSAAEILEREASGVARTEINDQLSIARSRGRKEIVRDDSLTRAPSLKERMQLLQKKSDELAAPPRAPLVRKQGIERRKDGLTTSKSSDCVLENRRKCPPSAAFSDPSLMKEAAIASQAQDSQRVSLVSTNKPNPNTRCQVADESSQRSTAERGDLGQAEGISDDESHSQDATNSEESVSTSLKNVYSVQKKPQNSPFAAKLCSAKGNCNDSDVDPRTTPIRSTSRQRVQQSDILQREDCGVARSDIKDQLAIARTRGRKAQVQDVSLNRAPSLKDRMKAFQ